MQSRSSRSRPGGRTRLASDCGGGSGRHRPVVGDDESRDRARPAKGPPRPHERPVARAYPWFAMGEMETWSERETETTLPSGISMKPFG